MSVTDGIIRDADMKAVTEIYKYTYTHTQTTHNPYIFTIAIQKDSFSLCI